MKHECDSSLRAAYLVERALDVLVRFLFVVCIALIIYALVFVRPTKVARDECARCGGDGKILIISPATRTLMYMRCPDCKGTGKKPARTQNKHHLSDHFTATPLLHNMVTRIWYHR